jgi:hypothetical protein
MSKIEIDLVHRSYCNSRDCIKSVENKKCFFVLETFFVKHKTQLNIKLLFPQQLQPLGIIKLQCPENLYFYKSLFTFVGVFDDFPSMNFTKTQGYIYVKLFISSD